MVKKQTLIDNAIKALDNLAEAYPESVLVIETPSGYVSINLSSAVIYNSLNNYPLIMIDAQ